MKVLSAIRAALQADSTITTLASGGVHIIDVPEDSKRPNLMLMVVAGADDWTHQGADGLHQDVVRVYSRGDTQADAINLAIASQAVLNGLITSAHYGVSIQLTQHVNTIGDKQDDAKVYRQIDDYRVHYRLD